MDIGSIGTQYMNSPYIPFSSSAPASAFGSIPKDENTFGNLLKKAESTKTSSRADGVHSSHVAKKTPIDKHDKLYEQCMELETFIIKNLIKSMRGTVQKSDLVDTGFAGEMYEDMLYDEYAKTFAKNANFGFAEMAYKELSGQR